MMGKRPLTISIPGSGMMATVSKYYGNEEKLTDVFIQEWFYDLYRAYLAEPDYLLLSRDAYQDVHRMMMEDLRLYYRMVDYAGDPETGERAERYPNKVAGSLVTLVVFPDLPEKTLFAASLLKMADERSWTNGLGDSVTHRTYEKLRETRRYMAL